ncbi:AAA family ATPase [Trabulsiella odontotermitis]|uniref:AAA family ATPase n=1 Tax=Trabulsiella odontotermitis TaxID=379893 RepID=UPI00067674D0|nr:AAA family ATPase [Trabulsiella odontotermitis]KNC89682.1 XRE family transcriptional regulator [Trabulsiella odontotermitis]
MIRDLTELMARRNWSQTQVARAIGKSPTVINQYLHGKYPGDMASLERDIAALIKREADKEKGKRLTVAFVRTYTATRCLEVIRLAHLDCDINVIFGDAGMGKTMIMRQYALENPGAILLEADPGYTARVVLEEICARLGLNRRGNMHELSDGIIGALRDSGRVLLIDEAENLPLRALEVIRRIHDKAGIGVVLAGMPRLIINLKGKRGELKQLYSRVGFALALGDVLPRQDIDEIAASVLDDAQDPAVGEALFTASRGNARRLFKLLRGVHRHSQLNGVPVNAGAVRKFSEMLIN